MRALAPLLVLCGCVLSGGVLPGCTGPTADDTDGDTADDETAGDTADVETAGDTDTDLPDDKVDTGLALVYVEGSAVTSVEAWIGEEAYVSTSTSGAIEHCRITNVTEGVPSAELCPGCSFAFDIVLGAGAATGDNCEHMRFTADMFEGDAWAYAFAPTYTYGSSGYTYDDVLLFGYEYGGTFVWTPWAFAELVHGGPEIDYESIFAYTAYYYAL
ncbi:MAG: hypothetical protein Q8P18_14600 [Pseudomonadota bacterium]|nr:hypothetical protein [Pseudomonadota bacterium]